MTQVTAMFVMFVLYGLLPAAGLYLGYRGIKKMTAPKMLEYKAMLRNWVIFQKKACLLMSKPRSIKLTKKVEKLRLFTR